MKKNNLNRVLFLGRKPGASKALKYLLKKGIKVNLVLGSAEETFKDALYLTAKEKNITFISDDKKLYEMIAQKHKLTRNVDLVISYLYGKKIKQPLIDVPKLGCINFHPAPLPDYKGRAGYNTAILEGKKEYGVSVHFIDSEKLDSGPIIKVLRFPVSENENAMTLYEKTQKKLLTLFKQTVPLFLSGDKISVVENKGGLFLNRQELENLKIVDLEKESPELINKKIRAFFFPPYTGAKINISGQEFTLVNDQILKFLADLLNK